MEDESPETFRSKNDTHTFFLGAKSLEPKPLRFRLNPNPNPLQNPGLMTCQLIGQKVDPMPTCTNLTEVGCLGGGDSGAGGDEMFLP